MPSTASEVARVALLMFERRLTDMAGGNVSARDGDGGGWGVADTPYKKVRVVTTVDFYLR